MIKVGLDIGSTTIKYVVIDQNDEIILKNYKRHYALIEQNMKEIISEICDKFPNNKISINISGSAGMGFAGKLEIPFVQEVYATRLAIKKYLPETDVVIELGGEDAKILFISGVTEVRMNGSCAGGTGAFIDQMATLLKVEPIDMNELAKNSQKSYTIASRCGVFAKSDIQPLLNQGASKEDISISVFNAVASQTVAGLAQGREITGNVVYLGGPLTFFSELRGSFDKTLKLTGTIPDNSLYFVAIGTAEAEANKTYDGEELKKLVNSYEVSHEYDSCEPLFKNEDEYNEFIKRHKIGEEIELANIKGKSYIGVDAGSTTLKAVLVNEDEEIVYYKYSTNGGNPVALVKDFLLEVYELYPNIEIGGFATTGYGEQIIKNAFNADKGLVETLAHFTAAKKFDENVDFIIDIGGQDIKCFKVQNQNIDNIFLNEACSSGCGSFLQTFSQALGKEIEEFSKLGLFADKPVELGSRCTVFMNSSIKQAQKDGATIENISAGLSMSVVKNALYKVIRITNSNSLGNNIVVQGGTFLNDAVLRAFEKEINKNVVRPQIAGLMGAYGASLYVKHLNLEKSKIMSYEELKNFEHKVVNTNCKICGNNCSLTINTFNNKLRYIAGNRCEKPIKKQQEVKHYNMFDYKKELINEYSDFKTDKPTLGIPLVLNNYEMLPFWHTFFKELGFGVKITKESTRETYLKGQNTIPSDTVCYPAKLVHGHIEELNETDIDYIFYPCMSYNFKEDEIQDNHYNCPVVAYYPEVIEANSLKITKPMIKDYIGVHLRKYFDKKIYAVLSKYFNVDLKEIKKASVKAYAEYDNFLNKLRIKGEEFLEIASKENIPVIVLVGRPYHLDAEINHGIDQLIIDSGCMLVTEDAVSHLGESKKLPVLNQWTYHSRLYKAADYVANKTNLNINLVQLVSFGCGIDAITTDTVRQILESKKKIYTQLKIDEITNLGAVKIRLRSLFATTGME